MDRNSILIVDDEKNILTTISMALKSEGYKTVTSETAREALQTAASQQIDLAILDILRPEMDGLELLKIMKEKRPDTIVIMMSGHGSISTAVQATKLGAYDFMEKPLSREKLLLTVKRALEFRRLEDENIELRSQIAEKYDIIGESRQVRELLRQIAIIGPSPSRVLIRGENGTGKELVARALHKASHRRNKPFIKVNCAAIPHDLIESELFGHEKGAFTGATAMHRGKFELAHHGTIFLDEIGDMHLDTQAKVLRVLQESEFQRVGGDEVITVDVRVIAATNKDIEKEIKSNRFREDLYFRLNVIPFRVHSLREHAEDIHLLADHFLASFSMEYGRPAKTLDDSAHGALRAYNWPGNIRELRNIIERVFIMSPEDTISDDTISMFLPRAPEHSAAAGHQAFPSDAPLKDVLFDFEKNFLRARLKEDNFHISETAKKLKIERSHLYKKIKQFDIKIPRTGDEE